MNWSRYWIVYCKKSYIKFPAKQVALHGKYSFYNPSILFNIFGTCTKLQWPHLQIIYWTACSGHPARLSMTDFIFPLCCSYQWRTNKEYESWIRDTSRLHFAQLSFPNKTNSFLSDVSVIPVYTLINAFSCNWLEWCSHSSTKNQKFSWQKTHT